MSFYRLAQHTLTIRQTAIVYHAGGILILLLGERVYRMFKPRPGLLDRPAVFFLAVFVCILVVRLPPAGVSA